jgi:hypothetical protein
MSELRDTVRKALETRSGDPRDLVDDVLAQLPDELVREALRETLPNYIRLVQSSAQRPTRKQVDALLATPEVDAGQLPDMTVFARGEWKPLATCDADDLADMAGRRDQQATGNATFAELYRHIARGGGAPVPAVGTGTSLETLVKRRDQLRARLAADALEPRRELVERLEELRGRRDRALHAEERDAAIFRLVRAMVENVDELRQHVVGGPAGG